MNKRFLLKAGGALLVGMLGVLAYHWYLEPREYAPPPSEKTKSDFATRHYGAPPTPATAVIPKLPASQAGGGALLELDGYRFQALLTNLPASVDAVNVWRRYNGRADLENRIKELGEQFGIKRLYARSLRDTEALHHLASPLTTCACCCNGSGGSCRNAS